MFENGGGYIPLKAKELITVITGAGCGLGKGMAEVFAEEGAFVVIADLNDQEGKLAEEEIRSSGGHALFIHTDVCSEKSIQAMVKQVMERYGKIDSLINNAGITLFKPLMETTLDDWDRIINVNLRGVLLCSKYVAEQMIELRSGSIINISSVHAFETLPDAEIYAASKAGVNGMTRSMALSLGKYGIRVNAICPGFIETDRYWRWINNSENPTELKDELLSMHAVGRVNTPRDIGKLALYLASADSAMMTGAELLIDGGLAARLYKAKSFR
jgi:NAD(P)-dependent dehydrogenase (short-subunit alcohol dehydrogenase family)